jgi:hypothetical protein
VIRRCTFLDNRSGAWGGAACAGGPAAFQDCLFIGNATTDVVKGYGGALAIVALDEAASIRNCTFIDNTSGTGGGLCVSKYTVATVVNCTFCANSANSGAGLGFYYADTVTLVNSIIAHSQQGSAVGGNATKILTNCNLYGNAGGDWIGDIAGQFGINGNISADPLFVDHGNADCHLGYDSPCRDSGDNTAPGLPAEDCEGDPRISQGFVDMGADEFHPHLYVTGDETPGGSIQGNLVGPPGTPQVGLFLGAGVLDPPMPTLWGLFHLQSPWFLIMLFPIPAGGVMALPATLPLFPPAPYDLPMQAIIGDELTNLHVMHVR